MLRKRQVHSYRDKEREDKGGVCGGAGPSVAVASLSSPHWSSGGFPESPAVLNKSQSSTRQCSKTCYFSPLPSNPGWNFKREVVDNGGRYMDLKEVTIQMLSM